MRIFISSVRRGLEEERDALPGLLKALGHEPVIFEQFTATGVPSREACLAAVDSSEAYVVLMGARYGDPLPETGQSPTHDEVVRAKHNGTPRLVFVKSGVEMEPLQKDLLDELQAYSTGVFRGSFGSTADLMIQVTAAVRELESAPSVLKHEPLAGEVDCAWRSDWTPSSPLARQLGSAVELHAIPVPSAPIPARVLRASTDRLVRVLRESNAVAAHEGLQPEATEDFVSIEVPPRREDHMLSGRTRSGGVRGLRLSRSGQASVWWLPPGDGMGIVLSTIELPDGFAAALRLLGEIAPARERYALAAGVTGSFVSVIDGPPPSSSRTQASFGHSDEVRVHPDEVVSAAAFGAGASEMGRELASALIDRYSRTR